MKIKLLYTLMALTTCVCTAQPRPFTTADGRNLEAELMSFDSKKNAVSVKLKNGRKGTVPLKTFCSDDQLYIKNWSLIQEFGSKQNLKLSIRRLKGEESDYMKSQRGFSFRKDDPVKFEISLKNRSSIPFEKLTVEYCIFNHKKPSKGSLKSDVFYETGGFTFSPTTEDFQSIETISVTPFYWTHGSYDLEGNAIGDEKIIFQEKVEGIAVRLVLEVSSEHKAVREIFYPESISKKFTWPNEK